MTCNCDLCNARDFYKDTHYKNGRYVYEPETNIEEKTIYESIKALRKKMEKRNIDKDLIDELERIADKVDKFDNELIRLQAHVISHSGNPVFMDEIQFALGELSKKIY